MFIKSVDKIVSVFNKAIKDLNDVADTQNMMIAANNDAITRFQADTEERAKEVAKANAIRAKLEELVKG